MSKASWGGQSNLSDLFTSLVNEDYSRIQSGVNEALRNAQAEQSAKDTETQAKWQAGKISDEQWLAYIKDRIAGTTDPQQRAQWEQILLQNQDAISDAQWETKFQQNKITVGQLIQHYRSRMAGVAGNSPAYRDLATRLTDLVQFQSSGGTYYRDQYRRSGSRGSGGSGGGAGGKGSTSLSSVVSTNLKGGPTPIGYQGGEIYNTQGPDVVSVLFGKPQSSGANGVALAAIDGLQGSMTQLEAFFKFHKDNPNATVFTDPYGHVIPINPTTIRAADDQYLRLKQTTAAVYYAKGDRSSGDKQMADATDFVANTMRLHNLDNIQPALDAFLQQTKAQLILIGKTPDPAARAKQYGQLAQAIDAFAAQALPSQKTTGQVTTRAQEGADKTAGPQQQNVAVHQTLALENMVDQQTMDQFAALRQAVDIGAHPSQYADADVSAAFDHAHALGSIGVGPSKIDLAEVYQGSATASLSSTLGAGFTGTADSRVQLRGLNAAKMIESGAMAPSDAVDDNGDPLPLFTYAWDGKNLALVNATAKTINGVPTVVPQDGSGNAATDSVAFVTDVQGVPAKVWTPVSHDAPAVGFVYRTAVPLKVKINGQDVILQKGDLVPSSVLAGLNVSSVEKSGQIVRSSLPGTVTANIGGRTWYYDARSNEWSPTMPWNLEGDPNVKGAVFVSDQPIVQKSDGSYEIDRNNLPADNSLIAMGMRPGLSGFAVPWAGISRSDMQEWIDRQVAEGRINPTDYTHGSPDGHSMVPSDIATMYFDPNLESEATGQPIDVRGGFRQGEQTGALASEAVPSDPAVRQQALSQSAEVRQWVKDNIGSQRGLWKMETPDITDPNQAVANQIKQFGASMGIRTGDIGALAAALPGAVPGMQRAAFADPTNPYGNYGPGIADFQKDAFTAAANRLKQQALPKLEPLPAGPKPPLSLLEGVDKTPAINPLQSVQASDLSSISSTPAAVVKQRVAGKGLQK